MDKLNKVKEILSKYNQEYLLKYCDLIKDEKEKEEFLDEILNVDFSLQEKLYDSTKNIDKKVFSSVENVSAIDKNNFSEEELDKYFKIGVEEIKNGKLGVVTLAGGQGTRLGHTGPKGTYELLPNLSLFEILCNNFKMAYAKYGVFLNWYIMTSKDNYLDTVSFFEEKNYFNYPKEYITFFKQDDIPQNAMDGKLLFSDSFKIVRGANGHGGVFDSMKNTGVLEDAKKKKIEWIFVTPVDNPLMELVDPIFIGFAKFGGYNALGKSIVRTDPTQKQGVFCSIDDKLNVMEYTEIPKDLMEKVNEDGSLYLRYAHINCNMFNIKGIEKIGNGKLPYHSAFKKATYIDKDGNKVVPDSPNAYKFEAFLFDAFGDLDDMVILRVKRDEEFAPVKNATGVDSPETARALYNNLHKFHKINNEIGDR